MSKETAMVLFYIFGFCAICGFGFGFGEIISEGAGWIVAAIGFIIIIPAGIRFHEFIKQFMDKTRDE